MSSEEKKNTVTPTGRIVFHKNLFSPGQDQRGNDKYSASLILDKDAPKIKELQKLMREVALARFEEKVVKSKKFKWGMKTPDEDAIEKYEFFNEDVFILNCSTQFPVEVKGNKRMSNGKFEDLIDGDLKAGDHCRFLVSAYAWENKEQGVSRGVSLNLIAVQFVKEGEALYSRVASDDAFGEVEFDVEPEESTNTSEGEEVADDDAFGGW